MRDELFALLRSIKWRRWIHRPDLGSFGSVVPLGNPAEISGSIRDWYESEFLKRHERDLQGKVLEVGTGYTKFERLAELPSESWNAVICRDLHRVWDLETAVGAMGRLLMPDGVLLAVLPGVVVPHSTEDAEDYWRFTLLSAERLFRVHFDNPCLQISARGNVLAAISHLHGLPASGLEAKELSVSDPRQQLVVCVRASRC